MSGRFGAVAFAVLFVLPIVLTLDALVRPKEAWRRIGRGKWRWGLAFVAAPIVSALTGSVIPALCVLPLSFFYMAKVRSLLDVAGGMAATATGRMPMSRELQAALEPAAFFGPPVLVLLGAVLWTGGTRERLVASAMAVAVLGVVAAVVWRNFHRL